MESAATSTADRTVLRELARQVAEIAALPVQEETKRLWKSLNGLRPVRPLVLIDQIPWHEMDVDGELTCRCQGEFERGLETRLRRTLYLWKHMRADMVVEPLVDLRMVFRDDGFGIRVKEETSALDQRNDVVGHAYEDQLRTEADVEKIHAPRIELDEAATARLEERARGIFEGLLTVRMMGYELWFRPWDILSMWHKPEGCLTDLALRPEFVHRILERLTAALFAQLDDLESRGLLCRPQSLIHCTGAWTDELPSAGYDERRPRAKDLWTAGMAQIFSSVSPAMHEEFEIDYAVKWYDRFGLGYYGCCEPLDNKIDLVRRLPRVRKISISAWADVDKAAERIGRQFVFSRKPPPALLARDAWSPSLVEADLRQTLAACRREGCPMELILKDISTVRYEPRRLWEWSRVAMRLAAEG
jgi:hypothetical protein